MVFLMGKTPQLCWLSYYICTAFQIVGLWAHSGHFRELLDSCSRDLCHRGGGIGGSRGSGGPCLHPIFFQKRTEEKSDKFQLLALPDFLTFRHNLRYLHPPRGQISTLVCVCRYATEIQKDKFSLNYTNNL